MRFTRASAGLAGLLFVAVALVCAEIQQNGRNTLGENGRWISIKTLLEKRPMGSEHFVHTRNALAGRELHLDAWHGYQAVVLDAFVEPASVSLRYRLAPRAWIAVLLHGDEGRRLGVRLSRDERKPSMLFRADADGRFTSRQPIADPPRAGAWHRLRLELGAELRVRLDGTEVHAGSPVKRGPTILGLRSGSRPTRIDDIEIVDDAGNVAFAEDFSSRRSRAASLAWGIGAASLPIALTWLAGALRQRTSRPADLPLRFLATQLSALVLATLFLVFDDVHWSRLYPYEGMTPTGRIDNPIAVPLERLRASLLGGASGASRSERRSTPVARAIAPWAVVERRRVPKRAQVFGPPSGTAPRWIKSPAKLPGKEPRELRVAFIGTSQTFGSGARRYEQSLVASVHDALLAQLPEGTSLITANLALPGSRAALLLEDYTRRWHALEPDLVVVNLSVNDRADPEFADALRGLAEQAARQRARLVFVLEARSRESANTGLPEKHAIVREVARSRDLPVLDLHGYLAKPAVDDAGFLWWDEVHMTSLGQAIAGRWLAGHLAGEVDAILLALSEREIRVSGR